MAFLDSALDTTLAGYTKFGVSLRSIDVDERFPEIDGKHVMVTGATGGIGKAVAQRLAANGATVHAVGRSQEKLDALVSETSGTIVPHKADLSSMQAIVDLADAYLSSGEPLHGLVNNVGIMIHERTETDEGYEITYATNLLGQYVLTKLLLPALSASAPSRVVMVSSGGLYSQPLTVTNLESSEGEYNGTNAYARTKRAEVVLAEEWASEFEQDDVSVTSMHPGWVDTAGVQSSLPTFRRITGPFLRNEAEGADTIVWLIASNEASDASGAFYHDRQVRPTHRMNRTVEDPALRTRFMEHMEADAARWLDSQPGSAPDHAQIEHTDTN